MVYEEGKRGIIPDPEYLSLSKRLSQIYFFEGTLGTVGLESAQA